MLVVTWSDCCPGLVLTAWPCLGVTISGIMTNNDDTSKNICNCLLSSSSLTQIILIIKCTLVWWSTLRSNKLRCEENLWENINRQPAAFRNIHILNKTDKKSKLCFLKRCNHRRFLFNSKIHALIVWNFLLILQCNEWLLHFCKVHLPSSNVRVSAYSWAVMGPEISPSRLEIWNISYQERPSNIQSPVSLLSSQLICPVHAHSCDFLQSGDLTLLLTSEHSSPGDDNGA